MIGVASRLRFSKSPNRHSVARDLRISTDMNDGHKVLTQPEARC